MKRKTKKTCKSKADKLLDINYSPEQIHNQMRRKRNKLKRHGKKFWKYQEEKLYIQYLTSYKSQFSNPVDRRNKKMFILMSAYIRIRGPDQCRSHHQKMMLKYGSLDKLIEGISKQKLGQSQQSYPTDIVKVQEESIEQRNIQFEDQKKSQNQIKETGDQKLGQIKIQHSEERKQWNICQFQIY